MRLAGWNPRASCHAYSRTSFQRGSCLLDREFHCPGLLEGQAPSKWCGCGLIEWILPHPSRGINRQPRLLIVAHGPQRISLLFNRRNARTRSRSNASLQICRVRKRDSGHIREGSQHTRAGTWRQLCRHGTLRPPMCGTPTGPLAFLAAHEALRPSKVEGECLYCTTTVVPTGTRL